MSILSKPCSWKFWLSIQTRLWDCYLCLWRKVNHSSKSCTFWPPNEDHGIGDYMFVIFQNSYLPNISSSRLCNLSGPNFDVVEGQLFLKRSTINRSNLIILVITSATGPVKVIEWLSLPWNWMTRLFWIFIYFAVRMPGAFEWSYLIFFFFGGNMK